MFFYSTTFLVSGKIACQRFLLYTPLNFYTKSGLSLVLSHCFFYRVSHNGFYLFIYLLNFLIQLQLTLIN